jgi:hypothetical protein
MNEDIRNADTDKLTAEDRRLSIREPIDAKVEVVLETTQLVGSANNVSQSGILFFTDGDLRVTVRMESEGGTREMTGSLVRCERIKGDHRGWAVEFDEASQRAAG